MRDWAAGLRIDDMRNPLPIELIIVTVAPGGADTVTVDIHNRLYGVLLVGRFLNRHPPRITAGIHAAAD